MRDTLMRSHRPPALLVRAEYPAGSDHWRTLGVVWSYARAELLACEWEADGARIVVTKRKTGEVVWDTGRNDGPLE